MDLPLPCLVVGFEPAPEFSVGVGVWAIEAQRGGNYGQKKCGAPDDEVECEKQFPPKGGVQGELLEMRVEIDGRHDHPEQDAQLAEGRAPAFELAPAAWLFPRVKPERVDAAPDRRDETGDARPKL